MSKKVAEKVLRYTAIFDPCEEGGFTVTVPKLPGLVTEGDTFEEAVEMAKDAIRGHLEVLADEGLEIPEPDEDTLATPIEVPVSFGLSA